MCRNVLAVAALASISMAAPARAGTGGGAFAGPDDSFQIDLTLRNQSLAGIMVTSIQLDGDFADAFPILWDDSGASGGSASAALTSITGIDTHQMVMNFSAGFDPGETFTLTSVDPDGDPGSAGVTVSQLIGVRATFRFSDRSAWTGEFVDDSKPGQGIFLREVPAPGALSLAACSGLTAARRRRPHTPRA